MSADEVKAQGKVTEKQEKERRKTAGIQNGLQNGSKESFEKQKEQYLERLLRTGMSEEGINLLENMMDDAFKLGNINAAEFHDLKWFLRGLVIKINGRFPPPESAITGRAMQFVRDDEQANLQPLTDRKWIIIGEMIEALTVLSSRSRDGFQQEMLVKSISVSEIVDEETETDSSLIDLNL